MYTTLARSQRDEIEADVLGFLIVAESVNGPGYFPALYKGLFGSVIGLISLAHLTDSWIANDQSDSHPGFLDRFEAISTFCAPVKIEW